MRLLPCLCALAALLGCCFRGAAQSPDKAPAPSAQDKPVGTAQPVPQVKLGLRVENIRRRLGVIPTVVIVPDPRSYIAAIKTWTLSKPPTATEASATTSEQPPKAPLFGSYFPILIDDGTWQSREDIARFVRGFEPASVVRWSAPKTDLDEAKDAKLAPVHATTTTEIETALSMAWGEADPARLLDRWALLRLQPVGIVVASENDPAWTGALALAAGRGQPIAWVKPPRRGVDERFSMEQCDQLSTSIEEACTRTGYAWSALGDQLDAVTLCLNSPDVVQLPKDDKRVMLAVTDLVGRTRNAGERARWAWTGHVFGSESRAAYNAMCALFLQQRSAWLFDGYEHSQPWSQWDVTPAAEDLSKAEFACIVDDNGRQGDNDWRRRIAGAPEVLSNDPLTPPGGMKAGLIAVNTKGYPDYFELRPGVCNSTDVPLLNVPAMVHFVHSWSANQVTFRRVIAGRFIANGAYAYVGAVNEPTLQAFVPTPQMVRRMLAGAPWGVAVRLDDAAPGKVTVIGDPLIMIGARATRLPAALPLTGVVDIVDTMGAALKAGDFIKAVSDLVVLGRDADAASLMRAIQSDKPVEMTEQLAMVGIMPVYRSAWPVKGGEPADPPRHEFISRLAARIGAGMSAAPELRDVLWHGAYTSMGSLSEETIEVLKKNLRPEQLGRDAIDLAGAVRRRDGAGAARAYLSEVRAGTTEA
ncbi:MAG: hypothetical protein H7210_02590, partial [Pyrinomonadaceae bacterium]|nr:hypothetical protein [Phycisphaerales bacterium]